MMEKWVRVIVKNGDQVLWDARYLVAAEDRDALYYDVLSASKLGAKIEMHEFWAPESERKHYDSGNPFAIR